MSLYTTLIRSSKPILAAAMLSLAAPAVWADEQSPFGGLLRRGAGQASETVTHPLPAKDMVTARKDWGHFQVTNITTNETFNLPIFPHYPVEAGVQQAQLSTVENDGKTLIAPVDLTGRGLSDLLIGRQGWGGFRVYTNGQSLPKPFDGFVEGLYPKEEATVKTKILAMDLADLQVDNNLLVTVGDFLGNGTEQLAYFRPGWSAIQVVGSHGKVAMEADLRGIPADKEGDRLHFLFAFKDTKPGERTRLAYHRHGVPKLLVFTSDGQRFTRTEEDAKTNWNLLNQYHPNPL